jgi:hypothetical protein
MGLVPAKAACMPGSRVIIDHGMAIKCQIVTVIRVGHFDRLLNTLRLWTNLTSCVNSSAFLGCGRITIGRSVNCRSWYTCCVIQCSMLTRSWVCKLRACCAATTILGLRERLIARLIPSFLGRFQDLNFQYVRNIRRL